MLHKVLASLLALFTLAFCPAAYAGSYGEVQLAPSYKASYRASTGYFTTAASATDVAILNGSASKTVKVTNIWLTQGGVTSGALSKYFVIKRSTANSGGTSTTATSVPLDSSNAAASVSGLKLYTANPTPGSTVGPIADDALYTGSSSGSLADAPRVLIYHADPFSQACVLRGTAEGLAVNFNGVTNPQSTSVSITYEWTEE
jgi:hypothetical protein